MLMPFHAGGRGFYFLFAIVHQRCLLRCGCFHLSKQQAAVPASSALFITLLMLVPPGFAMVILLN
jgi:hypothetical protein